MLLFWELGDISLPFAHTVGGRGQAVSEVRGPPKGRAFCSPRSIHTPVSAAREATRVQGRGGLSREVYRGVEHLALESHLGKFPVFYFLK